MEDWLEQQDRAMHPSHNAMDRIAFNRARRLLQEDSTGLLVTTPELIKTGRTAMNPFGGISRPHGHDIIRYGTKEAADRLHKMPADEGGHLTDDAMKQLAQESASAEQASSKGDTTNDVQQEKKRVTAWDLLQELTGPKRGGGSEAVS